MEFDYDFSKCAICDGVMYEYGLEMTRCKNKCCIYDFDTDERKTIVFVYIFNDSEICYFVDRYKDNDSNSGFLVDNESFLKIVKYWRENERYLMRMLVDNEI